MPTMKGVLRQLFRLIGISSFVSILLWQTREGFTQPRSRETLDIFRRNQLLKQYEESVQFNAHELNWTTANMAKVFMFKGHEPETYKSSSLRNAVRYGVMEHGTKDSDLGSLMDNWVADVEVHDYAYLINPHQKCDVPPHLPKAILLVICVLSAPQNWERRDVIRSTYGNESVWPASREGASMVRVVFMLGAVKDVALQASIEAEAARFGDIVQENFVDSYLNLTRKTVMTLKWVTKFCGNAIFMMKADDDIILNVQKVTAFLLLSPPEDFTAGKKGKPIRVMRTKNSKYYTPYHVYNSTHYHPYYLGGAGYFFSLDVAYRILDMAQRIPLFPWEDIFVSNCMRELGIPITRTKNFAWGKYTVSNGRLINDTQCIRFRDRYLVAKGLPANHMMKLWTFTQAMT